MVTIARMSCLVALLAFSGCVTSWDSGYRATTQEAVDIFTAVLQSRLARTPLPKHQDLYLYLEPGVGAALPHRFPDYHIVVRGESWDSSPPHGRWYSLKMGRYTPNKAYVMLFAVERSGYLVELRKRDGKWIAVDEQEMIVTQRTETPYQAMQRPRKIFALGIVQVPRSGPV